MSRVCKGFVASAALVLGGCINASTLSTARSLPPGDHQLMVGGGWSHTELVIPGEITIKSGGYGEVGYRLGLVKGLEMGARATVLGTGGLDLKYQFLDLGPLAVAAGAGFGTLARNDGDDTATTTTTTGTSSEAGATPTEESKPSPGIADLFVPVYASWDVGSHLAAYSCVKYMFRYVKGLKTSFTQDFVAGTLGVKLGDAWGLLAEGSFVKGIHGDDSFQANAAVFWSR